MELNKIHCCDCIEFITTLPDKCIDLIVTDPPYKFKLGGHKGFYKNKKWNNIKKIEDSFGHDFNPDPILTASIRIMKIYNAYFWTSKSLVPDYLNFAIKNKFAFNILTWHKTNCPPLINNNFLPDTEYCIHMRAKGACFNSKLNNINLYHKYFITHANQFQRESEHPCPKPLAIPSTHIQISSKENDLIFDPFIGSGTTAVACRGLNRNFIGCEINPEYCQIAERRLSQEVMNLL